MSRDRSHRRGLERGTEQTRIGPSEPSDDDLLLATDAASFALFYRRHVNSVLAHLARRTRDPDLAADLCAEVFAAALVARRRYRRGDGDARGWLFRIASNKLNDALRRGYAEDRAQRRLGMERVAPDEEDLRLIERLGAEDASVVMLDSLPDDQRQAVQARVLDEGEYDEIAARLGVSEAVVRKRVSRGLAALRASIRWRE